MTTAAGVVTVAYAAPDVEVLIEVPVREGATVGAAVAESGIVARLALDPSRLEFAIYGRRVRVDTPVADGDRVEMTRPLLADPKSIRRSRAAKPGQR